MIETDFDKTVREWKETTAKAAAQKTATITAVVAPPVVAPPAKVQQVEIAPAVTKTVDLGSGYVPPVNPHKEAAAAQQAAKVVATPPALQIAAPAEPVVAALLPEAGASVIFKDIVQPIVARGIPVIPLLPRKKYPDLLEWQLKASVDPAQIDKWASERPDSNFGCVAYLGGFWFLEVDSKDVQPRIESETSKTIPKTFRVRSRAGRGHIYFKATPASDAMGNVSQGFVKGKDFSVRVDREFVCGPGSIHPDSGKPYEVVCDAEIVPAPDWLVAWVISQKVGVKIATGDGGVRTIEGGSRNVTLASMAGTMRRSGTNANAIEAALLVVNSEQCVPPLDEDEVKVIAGSIARYPAGNPDAEVPTLGGVKVGTAPVPKSGNHELVAATPFEIDTTGEGARPVFPYAVLESTSLNEGLVKPGIAGTSSKHAEFLAMVGIQTFLNYMSGRVRIKGFGNQFNLFVGLISPFGAFHKSSSCEMAFDYFKQIGLLDKATSKTANANAKILLSQGGSSEGFGLRMTKVQCKNAIFFNDELSKFVAKASIESASLVSDMKTWFSSGDTGNNVTTGKNCWELEAGSYCFSWTWATTTRAFDQLWPRVADAEDGMADRMFFVVSPKEPKPPKIFQQMDFPTKWLETTRRLIDAAVSQGVFEFEDYPDAQQQFEAFNGNAREISFIMKLALYFTVDTGCSQITSDAVYRAIELVRFRRECLVFLAPIEADNKEARLQQIILRELTRNNGVMTRRELQRALSYNRLGPRSWREGYDAMLYPKGDGRIREFDETLTTKTGAVRTKRMVCKVKDWGE